MTSGGMTTVGSGEDGMTNGVAMAERSPPRGPARQACGDAPACRTSLRRRGEASMIGVASGPYAPGQWSDDTEMAVGVHRSGLRDGVDHQRCADDATAEGFEEAPW